MSRRAMIGGALAGLLVLITFSVSAFMIPVAAEPASSLHHSASFLHHDVKIRIDPSRGAIKVVDRITIDGAKVKALRLAPWLTFSRLEIDGAAVPLARADSVLRLPQTPVDPREIIVSYAGKPPATGDDHGARSAPGGAIGSQGTFLPGGAGWLPHLDTGPGAATYRLHVAVPGNQVAVATGRLVEEHTDPDGYEAVFVAERPGEEPSLFAGPYTVRERRHGWIRLRTYFHAEDGELAKAYLDAAAGYLDAFSARIGAYPFEGLAIVSSPFPVGLGFPGVTYVSRKILPLPFMRGRSLAHEILHNWWGSGVGVDYASGNWAEGLTTYMADYALAAAEGPEAARAMRYDWLRDFAALPPDQERPVISFVTAEHAGSQAIGYGKTAFIFHMLHQEVGGKIFEAALRRIWHRYRFATANWNDLQEAFETTANRDLDWFFAQWLERSGAPRVILREAQVIPANGSGAGGSAGNRAGSGGHVVLSTLGQDHEVYRLSVPIQVTTATATLREWVELDAAGATVRLDVPNAPLTVIGDPDYDVFRRLHPEETPPILRDVMLDPSTALLVATASPEAERLAHALARRLLGTEPRQLTFETAPAARLPLLLIGTGTEARTAIDALALGPVPAAITGRGNVSVWTGKRASGAPYAVIAAAGVDALAAVQRPLPHHGRASYLALQDSQAIVIGTWPRGHGPLRIDIGQ